MPDDAETRALKYVQQRMRERTDELMNAAFLGFDRAFTPDWGADWNPNYKNEVNADISQDDLDRARAGLRGETVNLIKGRDYQHLGVVRILK